MRPGIDVPIPKQNDRSKCFKRGGSPSLTRLTQKLAKLSRVAQWAQANLARSPPMSTMRLAVKCQFSGNDNKLSFTQQKERPNTPLGQPDPTGIHSDVHSIDTVNWRARLTPANLRL